MQEAAGVDVDVCVEGSLGYRGGCWNEPYRVF